MDYKLSPSDLTYLYEGCKHCFVLKVKHGVPQPSIPLPNIFTVIADLQKERYSGARTEAFCPELPPGVVTLGEKWVTSEPLRFPGLAGSCYLRGRFDIVVEIDGGGYAIIDFKTGQPTEEKVRIYSRQLHAYALALERPAPKELSLAPIEALGLLFFAPDSCDQAPGRRQAVEGPLIWTGIPRDDGAFMTFLESVVALLDGPMPDPETTTCDWCRYRRTTGGEGVEARAGRQGRTSVSEVPACPRCARPMRLRTGRNGSFWGCTRYPECRGTREAPGSTHG